MVVHVGTTIFAVTFASMHKRFIVFGQLFLIYSTVYLIALLIGPEWLVFWWKWSLLPVLIVAVLTLPNFSSKGWLLIALTFSWLGDIVISFAPQGEWYFIGGLVCFLLAHLSYIKLFWESIREHVQSRGYPTWAWSMVILFSVALLVLLIPKLGALRLPVILYALIISTMCIIAFKGWAHWQIDAGTWIVAGACSFVLSDSLLAINKFHTPLPFASLLIMATYLFAQWALVHGIAHLNPRVYAA
jgi:uncharacterized membrane protein YhhN